MHKDSVKIYAAVLILCVAGANSLSSQAFAKPPAKKAQVPRTAPVSAATSRSSDGQVVTKNADGSVEVTDGASAPQAAQSAGAPVTTGSQKVVARQVRTGPSNIDGVSVKRNADGSVEVSEPPTIERWGSQAPSSPTTYHKPSGTKKRKHK